MLELDAVADKNLYQCFEEERVINEEIGRALALLDGGKQFAFYNLTLSSRGRDVLDSVEITEVHNIILNTALFNLSLEEEITKALSSKNGMLIGDDQLKDLSYLFARLSTVVFGQFDTQNFEMHLRMMKAPKDKSPCTYWHLDKSREEVLSKPEFGREKRFIMPLKGTGTSYKEIASGIRNKFLKMSKEFSYYYGNDIEDCVEGDALSSLLSTSKNYSYEAGFGSIHVTSTNGAMHAEPNDGKDRLLLLISPIE
jgi:hypothetical protein